MKTVQSALAPTRTRVLKESGRLFRRQGFAATGMKAIASASQAPFGSLYHFFPGGKVDLGETVIREGGEFYLQLIEDNFAPFNIAAEAVESFFNAAAIAVEHSGFKDACPIATLALEVASTNERLRMATAEVFSSWVDAVAAHLHRTGLEKDRASDFAAHVLATLEGTFILARASRNVDVVRRSGRLLAELLS